MNCIRTEVYKGFDIDIYPDEMAEDPRCWGTPYSTMYCCHRRYNLGDEQPDSEWLKEYANEVIENGGVVLPLYLYDHSGITMNTSGYRSRWDSGQVGFIISTREEIMEYFGRERMSTKLRTTVTNALNGEVETYDHFISGEVYAYVVETLDGTHVDSCAGFYGYDLETNNLLDMARAHIDVYIKKQREERFDKLKALIKNGVPLSYREDIMQGKKIANLAS